MRSMEGMEGEEVTSAMKQTTSRRHLTYLTRLARTCALALLGAGLLAVVFTVRAGNDGTLPSVLACGLGTPQTMLANKIPALFYPTVAGGPQHPQGLFPLDYAVNTPVAFTEDLSRAPGAPSINSFTWRWSFGDGTGYFYTAQPTHTYTKPGTYDVTAWVYIEGSWADSDPFDSSQIHIVASIPANPPVAKISSSMPISAITQPVSFSADGSHAADGSQVTYSWNFNDGGSATGLTAKHPFALPGTTFVALVVTDARGAKSLATVNITIKSAGPTASLTASDLEVDAGGTIDFDGSHSTIPQTVAGDIITKYIWNFGDGSAALTTQTPTTSHRYAKAGSYKVTMTVFDQQGAQSVATLTVRVLGAASGGASPLLIGGLLVLLLALGMGIYAFWQQRRRAVMVRQYQEAQALARTQRMQRGPQMQQRQRLPSDRGDRYGRSGSYGNPNASRYPGDGSGRYSGSGGQGGYGNTGRQPAPRAGQPRNYGPSSGSGERRSPRRPGDSSGAGRGDW